MRHEGVKELGVLMDKLQSGFHSGHANDLPTASSRLWALIPKGGMLSCSGSSTGAYNNIILSSTDRNQVLFAQN